MTNGSSVFARHENTNGRLADRPASAASAMMNGRIGPDSDITCSAENSVVKSATSATVATMMSMP